VAKKYREAASKAAACELDFFFKPVEANPSLYRR
jgi:hypothetical protein